MTHNTEVEEMKKESRRLFELTLDCKLVPKDIEDALTTTAQRVREETIKEIEQWVARNATTEDTPLSDFPDNWVYQVDANELADYLESLSTLNK